MAMIMIEGRILKIEGERAVVEADIEELNKTICITCPQKRKPGMKQFEGFMARLFIDMVKLAKDGRINGKDYKGIVTSEDIREQIGATRYARIGDLKYWELLRQEKEWWHYGKYQLTDMAYYFLAGGRIAQRVTVSRGFAIGKSPETISLKEALGSEWNGIEDWIKDWNKGRATGQPNFL
jgi:hypothetical protein